MLVPRPGLFSPELFVANAWRRAKIIGTTFAALPRTVWDAHLAPVVPLLLGTVGVLSALRSRRGRRGLFFVIGIAALGLAPAASHLETRFLMTAFACGTLIAARGWSAIHSLLSRSSVHAAPLASLTHATIAAGIVISTLSHVTTSAPALPLKRLS